MMWECGLCGQSRESSSPPPKQKYVAGLWRTGRFELEDLSFDVALKKDRAVQEDCLSLVFGFDHDDPHRNSAEVGYVLFSRIADCFALRGMKVHNVARGRGLSKIFLALWLHLCLELGVRPATRCLFGGHAIRRASHRRLLSHGRSIEKPLISYALQHFSFIPRSTSSPAIELRIAPLDASDPLSPCLMWSPELQRLKSKVSKRSQKSQNLRIVEECPEKAKAVYINTEYGLPMEDLAAIRAKVDSFLGGSDLAMAHAYDRLCQKHPPREPG